MFSSRKQAGVAARLTKIATELQGLEKSGALLKGNLLGDAVAAHDAMQKAATSLQDALAAARAAETALPLQGWDTSVRLPLWRAATATAMQTCPGNGTRIGEGVHLFHDCPRSEISLRQTKQTQGAPYGLTVEVFGFEGSFLSIAVDVPDAVTTQVTPSHVIRAALDRRIELGGAVYLRLNVQSGPNTEQILRMIAGEEGLGWVEFDLGYVPELTDRVIDKMWLDVILENPAANRFELRDMTLAYRRRADM